METINTNFKVVALDESQGWKKEMLAKCGDKIETVYMFYASIAVHCCELTPSYELTPLYYYPAEFVSDEIDEELREVFVQTEDQVKYVHCSSIDALEALEIPVDSIETESVGTEEYKEALEEAEDYCRANPLIC